MDPPPPDDFDPYRLLEDQAYTGDDDGDEGDEDSDANGHRECTEDRPESPGGNKAPEITDSTHEDSMYERVFSIVLSLIRPPKDASPAQLRTAAVSLSWAVGLLYVILAIACGWASSIGLSNLASAVTELRSEVGDIRPSVYGMTIRDLHRSICNAENLDDRLTLNAQLQAEKVKYERVVGVPYLLPPCPVKP